MIALALISLVASIAYGALGYGFSSIAVPLALLLVTSRELNPAVVLVEVAMNAFALWTNRGGLPPVWRRAAFVMAGVAPGITLGTAILGHVDASALKLATFAALLPLILLQAAGYRRPVRSERAAGALLGLGAGSLYAVTTISGPPLAMFLANQGYAHREFRAGLALIRLAESVLALALYTRVGLFTESTVSLLAVILPGVAVGVPIGMMVIRRVNAEAFRRACMSFDAVIVAFGLSSLLRARTTVDPRLAYVPFAVVVAFVSIGLFRFLRAASPRISPSTGTQLP